MSSDALNGQFNRPPSCIFRTNGSSSKRAEESIHYYCPNDQSQLSISVWYSLIDGFTEPIRSCIRCSQLQNMLKSMCLCANLLIFLFLLSSGTQTPAPDWRFCSVPPPFPAHPYRGKRKYSKPKYEQKIEIYQKKLKGNWWLASKKLKNINSA